MKHVATNGPAPLVRSVNGPSYSRRTAGAASSRIAWLCVAAIPTPSHSAAIDIAKVPGGLHSLVSSTNIRGSSSPSGRAVVTIRCGDARPAPEVLVAGELVRAPDEERIAVHRRRRRPGPADVAAAAGLRRDGAPLLARRRTGEHRSTLLLPGRLRGVRVEQPERHDRRMHRRHQGDRRIGRAEQPQRVADRARRRRHVTPHPAILLGHDAQQEAGIAERIEVALLEVTARLALGALRLPLRRRSAGTRLTA